MAGFFPVEGLEAAVIGAFDNFIAAVERRGVRLKPASSGFHVLGFACPKCGDKEHDPDKVLDRIRLYRGADKQGNERGRWYCNHCKAAGDDVDFLERAFGLSFLDAYRAVMDEAPPDRPFRGRGALPAAPVQTPKPAPVPARKPESVWKTQDNPWPCPAWTGEAMALIQRLDFRNGIADARAEAEARQAIEQGRGIRLNNAPAFGLFWNPRETWVDPARWGLKRAKKFSIPRGIVIALLRYRHGPWCESPTVVGLLVRRAVPLPDGTRLQWVPFRDDGSDLPKTRTMMLGERGQPVVLVEAALDAALVYQEARARVAVVSTCGAYYRLDEDAAEMLRDAPEIWAWPDADAAGADAFRRWKTAFPQMKLIEMPKGPDGAPIAKDPTDLARLCSQNQNTPTVRQILEKSGVLNV